LQLEKSWGKHFHSKKARKKCWWNWHLSKLKASENHVRFTSVCCALYMKDYLALCLYKQAIYKTCYYDVMVQNDYMKFILNNSFCGVNLVKKHLNGKWPNHQEQGTKYLQSSEISRFASFQSRFHLERRAAVNSTNILWAAFEQYSLAKKLQNQTVSGEKLLKTLLNEKASCKMLVKLTPVADLIKLFFLRFPIFAV